MTSGLAIFLTVHKQSKYERPEAPFQGRSVYKDTYTTHPLKGRDKAFRPPEGYIPPTSPFKVGDCPVLCIK